MQFLANEVANHLSNVQGCISKFIFWTEEPLFEANSSRGLRIYGRVFGHYTINELLFYFFRCTSDILQNSSWKAQEMGLLLGSGGYIRNFY